MGKIRIRESSAYIAGLDIHSAAVMDYFRAIPPAELESAFTRALEVGAFCLERSSTAQQVDFVKREAAEVLAAIERAISALSAQVENALLQEIGGADANVLVPAKTVVDEALKSSRERLADIRSLIAQIDPTNERNIIEKVMRQLRAILDPRHSDSIPGNIDAVIRKAGDSEGVFSKVIHSLVESALEPATQELDEFAKEMRTRDAARDALSQTISKGKRYEDEVVKLLQPWTRVAGAMVQHVGGDNLPGDILIELATSRESEGPMRVVIEVRDRRAPKGRKAVSGLLARAIAARSANAAIYLSRTAEGLANELGEWAEGECNGGPFVTCTHEHLTTALRFLHMRKRVAELRRSAPEVDEAAIDAQVLRIRTALDRFKNIARRSNEIRSCTWEIDDQAANLRSEIREALTTIEDALRRKRPPESVAHKRTVDQATSEKFTAKFSG